MSSEEDEEPQMPESPAEVQNAIGEADEDTLRIMLSTDNHLGYCERDPVRGSDSFAAFEEVLMLAREKQCDMVLIAGDLFHDNKPSRRTMHKTMEIIRRYCMGPNPVKVKIVSDQASNFRGVHGTVNYEDEFYSVDLPIFSIHGNHDDPTRDGGTEMLAALDLLSVSNLVNYFGRQDEVDKVAVSPVLMQKGSTKVALYGMGNMRDERLNRMWQGKKVRFLRPEDEGVEEEEEEEEPAPWFNIFALHQNRDLGRGTKNCVHESMIPEWMDLVVWGHEHECRIDPQESVVGTFRITQPGSSVATSLTGGEAIRKHVGILDIRGDQFRLLNIPLTQVRSFVIGEISLQNEDYGLDPEDPKIDTKITNLLKEEVDLLIYQAQEKREELEQEARAGGNAAGDEGNPCKLHYLLQKPKEVLVRLKVEHSGFTTLNNQRFGAKFVGKVANPSDVLLFHRKRQESEKSGSSRKKKRNSALNQPMAPQELEEMNIEDLATEELAKSDKRLEVLDEQRLGLALDDFVSKEQKQALNDAMSSMLKKQQKILINREREGDRRYAEKEAAAKQEKDDEEDDARTEKSSRKRAKSSGEDDDKENLSDDDIEVVPAPKKRSAAASRRKAPSSKRKTNDFVMSDEEDETPPAKARSRQRPQRKTASSKKKYAVDSGSEAEDSEAVVDLRDDDDDDDDLDDMIEDDSDDEPKKRKKAAGRGKSSARSSTTSYKKEATKRTPARQSQLSFTSTKRDTSSKSTKRSRKTVVNLDDDEDSDEYVGSATANSVGLSGGWGTARTPSMKR